MKKLIISLCILLPCTMTFAGISIISQQHHVVGSAGGTVLSSGYDITQAAAVNGSASACWWDFGPFTEQNPGINEVSSSAGNSSVTAVDQSCWTFTDSWAIAESTYIFTPLTADLQFQYTGNVEMHSFENIVSARIYDITGDYLIDSRQWSTESSSGLTVNETIDYSLNTNHQYELKLIAEVRAGDNPGVTSELEVSIVPEPCTLLLVSAGIVCLRGLTRLGSSPDQTAAEDMC